MFHMAWRRAFATLTKAVGSMKPPEPIAAPGTPYVKTKLRMRGAEIYAPLVVKPPQVWVARKEAFELAEKLLTSPEYFNKRQLLHLKKKEVVQKLGRHYIDCGSSEVQVGIFSERMKRLQEHIAKNRKDAASRRTFMFLLQKRRRMLRYLTRTNPKAYNQVIDMYRIREGFGASKVSVGDDKWSGPRNSPKSIELMKKLRPSSWGPLKQAIDPTLLSPLAKRKKSIIKQIGSKKKKAGLSKDIDVNLQESAVNKAPSSEAAGN